MVRITKQATGSQLIVLWPTMWKLFGHVHITEVEVWSCVGLLGFSYHQVANHHLERMSSYQLF